ncbi:hypothetical protein CEXT_407691 [Caerostris extrusa]|uniref:Uncharacterized protein n=1 Tax=Caerostris extrusa TaxID=172846 RepID=A0AAV4MTK3_CAEEX|nr:hypothetical protein CEXT_407691 [Caerostris extrusa]
MEQRPWYPRIVFTFQRLLHQDGKRTISSEWCNVKMTLTATRRDIRQRIRSVPGNNTPPRIISPMMQPTDQMSTASERGGIKFNNAIFCKIEF